VKFSTRVYVQIFNFRDGHVTTFRRHSGPISAKLSRLTKDVRVSAFHRYHWFEVKHFLVGCAQDNSRRVPQNAKKCCFWIWLRPRYKIPEFFTIAPVLTFMHSSCLPSKSRRSVVMRPSSLGGGRILRRTLSVRLSVCPSRYCTERHVAPPSELQ